MIHVCTPTHGQVEATFMYDVLHLFGWAQNASGDRLAWKPGFGSILLNLRTRLIQDALDANATHVLFLDSDMRFPRDTLDRLLAHQQPVVCANYRQRTGSPLQGFAFRAPQASDGQHDWTARNFQGLPVDSTQKHGLEPVHSAGCGVMLIDLSVFASLRKPWFSMPFNGIRFTGEDVFFCQQLQAAGISVLVDHDLSQDVKHTGTAEF
jgi:hypothetical protein